jgi:hypothetical protein
VVTVLTRAKTLDAPFCQILTVPERSAQNSLPSGANARAVANLAPMVPLGAGSFEGATQGFVVGAGVPVTTPSVGVTSGVTLGDGRGVVDPQAAASTATPASASRRRIPIGRSADSGARLLFGDDGEVFACPGTDRIDHPLEVDTRRSELVRRAWRHL